MNFQAAVQSGFSNYANFRGRACRSEFWWWQLFLVLAGIAVTIIPDLAVTVRRLHDTDSSGWWILLALIPLVGLIVLIVWWWQEGSKGYNRFGADPLQPALTRLTASSRANR